LFDYCANTGLICVACDVCGILLPELVELLVWLLLAGLALWVLVSVLPVGSGFWYGLMSSYLVDLFFLGLCWYF
jgi:hypothetical protein